MKITGYYYWNGFTLVGVNNIIIGNVCYINLMKVERFVEKSWNI